MKRHEFAATVTCRECGRCATAAARLALDLAFELERERAKLCEPNNCPQRTDFDEATPAYRGKK